MVLVPCVAALAAVPAVASSRGGLMVGGLLAAGSVAGLYWLGGARFRASAVIAFAGVTVAAGFGAWLVWPQLKEALFPHIYVYPIGQSGGLKDFTLHARYEPPVEVDRSYERMIGLSQTNRQPDGARWSLNSSLRRGGGLNATLVDGEGTSRTIASDRQFIKQRGGQSATLDFVRQGDVLRLFVDGTPLVDTNAAATLSFGAAEAPFRYVWLGAVGLGIPQIRTREVALFDRALSEMELQVLREPSANPTVPLPEPILAFKPAWWNPKLWFSSTLADRSNLRESVLRLSADRPWVFGSGPGTLGTLLRTAPQEFKDFPDLHAHNDWLETRVTFGVGGLILLLAALGFALTGAFLKGGVPVPTLLAFQILLTLGGGLLHARFDFPLQNPAVLFVVLLLLCIASCLSWCSAPGRSRAK
jgi:hypothetical protein